MQERQYSKIKVEVEKGMAVSNDRSVINAVARMARKQKSPGLCSHETASRLEHERKNGYSETSKLYANAVREVLGKNGPKVNIAEKLLPDNTCAYNILFGSQYNTNSTTDMANRVVIVTKYRDIRLKTENKGYKIVYVGFVDSGHGGTHGEIDHAVIEGPKGGKMLIDNLNLFRLYKQLPYRIDSHLPMRDMEAAFCTSVVCKVFRGKAVKKHTQKELKEIATKLKAIAIVDNSNKDALERLNQARIMDRIVLDMHKTKMRLHGIPDLTFK